MNPERRRFLGNLGAVGVSIFVVGCGIKSPEEGTPTSTQGPEAVPEPSYTPPATEEKHEAIENELREVIILDRMPSTPEEYAQLDPKQLYLARDQDGNVRLLFDRRDPDEISEDWVGWTLKVVVNFNKEIHQLSVPAYSSADAPQIERENLPDEGTVILTVYAKPPDNYVPLWPTRQVDNPDYQSWRLNEHPTLEAYNFKLTEEQIEYLFPSD